MRELWMRLGVTMQITEEEEADILGEDWEKSDKAIRAVIESGRYRPDGEAYIPETIVEAYNENYGTNYEIVEPGTDF